MTPDPAPLHTLTVDGRLVHCYIAEAAPPAPDTTAVGLPVVLLHGLGCSSDAWRPAIEVLAARRPDHRVFIPDLPGFGCSAGPKEAMGMEDLADWVARLLDALGVARAHFAGNSMGCQVALALARRHPARVGGLVLVGATVGGRAVSFGRYALGLLRDGAREPPRYNLALSRMYAQMGVPRYLATTHKMLQNEPLLYAHEIDAPCLIVRGEFDGIIPDRAARELSARLPRGQFRRLDGTAHALMYSRPREFVETALPFWAQAAGCPPRE